MIAKTWSNLLLFTVTVLFVSGCCCNRISKLEPASNVKLKNFYTDNMVFQRDMPIVLCGTGSPGGKVTADFNGTSGQSEVAANGSWKLSLPPQPAGGPFTLTVSGKKQTVLKNVLIGDVWICSGQSNMEFRLKNAINAKQETAAANYPEIRLFTVRKAKSPKKPAKDVIGKWQVCTSKTASGFSAVGYFFGRKLYRDLKIPIGLINSSWGGTMIEPWISYKGFASSPEYSNIIKSVRASGENTPETEKARLQKQMKTYATWYDTVLNKYKKEAAIAGNWQVTDLPDAKNWKTKMVPASGDSIFSEVDGVAWFRKTVNIPARMAEKTLVLSLGAIDDCDETFFNGVKIGATGPTIPSHWAVKRRYKVPANLVKAGKNVIAVRIIDVFSSGGIRGPASLMYIKQGKNKIKLAGKWRYKTESVFDPKTMPKRPAFAISPSSQQFPTTLYNAMISPLTSMPVRGAIWYQGESNAGAPELYKKLLPLLIKDWRDNWHNPDMSFFFVQLASFERHTPKKPLPADYFKKQSPGDPKWARLREAQLETLSVPNTGMAVAIDIGDPIDIHPRNKQDVGTRLALAAERITYGMKIPYSGPSYLSMQPEKGKIRLKFLHVCGGLESKGGQLKQFAIAGKDRKFVWANAKIDGNTVVVWSDKVKDPVAVRYAWSKYPEGCNLYNKAGLPASPFRTDNW